MSTNDEGGTGLGAGFDTTGAPAGPDAAAPEATLPLNELTRETAAAVGVAGADSAPRGAVADAEDKGTATTVTNNIRLDKTRESIAFRLVWLLAAIIAGYLLVSVMFSQACWESDICDIKDAYGMAAGSFATVFAALLGLVGSVVGFYFGSQSKT